MILLVKLVFTAATLCYAWGYIERHRNNPLHQRLMITGGILTLAIAVVLVVGVHGFGESYAPAGWLTRLMGGERGARIVLVVHRVLATAALLCLVTQMIAGWRRLPLHHRFHRVVAPLWLLSYASGLVIFV